jgi:hypothetical protein
VYIAKELVFAAATQLFEKNRIKSGESAQNVGVACRGKNAINMYLLILYVLYVVERATIIELWNATITFQNFILLPSR